MPLTQYPHVALDAERGPIIEGTSMKVVQLVAEKLAYGWSPEELHLQHPYLSLGQIHAALAYYWDNQEEVDKEIAEQLDTFDTLRRAAETQQSKLATEFRRRLG